MFFWYSHVLIVLSQFMYRQIYIIFCIAILLNLENRNIQVLVVDGDGGLWGDGELDVFVFAVLED